MRSASFFLPRWLAACALAVVMASGFSALAQSPEQQDSKSQEKKAPQISDGERQLIDKIRNAADNNARLQAAAEYAKKYQKSPVRHEVVRYIGSEIARVQDPAQQIALAEKFATIFTGPGEADLINPVLIDAYTKSNRLDDAFRVGAAHLQKNPNDVSLLTRLALLGVDQARNNNPKYVQQSVKYGAVAIELIETGKKPESMDAAVWTEYQNRWLPLLYQYLGLVSLMSNERDEAKARLEKSASLNAKDPVTFMLLGSLANQEYQKLASDHQAMASGPMKDETLKQAQAKMDEVIELYARVVAFSEGNPQLERLRQQVLQDLTTYYKYRHKGSTEGLDQLIAKYKSQQ